MRPTALLSALAFAAIAWAQGLGRMAVRSIRGPGGLPDATVHALIQDRLGRYWAANDLGLFVGDGTTFLPVPTDNPGTRPGFSAVLEAGDGTLYALSQAGLWHLRGSGWRRCGASLPAPIPGQSQGLFRDGVGQPWLLWNGHLFRIAGPEALSESPLPGPGAEALTARPERPGFLLREGPHLWAGDGTTWEALPPVPLRLGEAFRGGVAESREGTRWVATNLRIFRLGKGDRAWSLEQDQGNHGFAGGIAVPAPGEVWAMGDESAFRLDRPELPLGSTATFSTYDMRLLLRDREGNLWANRNGLHRVGGPWRSYGSGDGLPSLAAWQVLRDPRGRLWCSTNTGLYRSRPGGWEAIWPNRLHGQIAAGPDGALWAVERLGGRILRFDLRQEGRIPLPDLPELRGVEGLRGAVASREELILPTRNRGLLWGRWQTGTWRWATHPSPVEPSSLRPFDDGAGGLQIVGVDGQGRTLHARPGGPWLPLPATVGREVTDLQAEGPDQIAVVRYTPPEVHILRRTATAWESVRKVDLGQFSPCTAAYGLRRLDARRTWILTDHGVLELDDAHPGRARHFTTAEGLPFDDCNQYGLFVERDRVWVSSGTGLASYDRRAEADPGDLPAPLLLAFHPGEDPWRLDLPATFPPGTKGLHFRFGVPTPARGTHLRYYWQDLERGPEWHPFTDPALSFLDVSPGPHDLRVRCLEPGGNPSPEWRARVEILRPWWQRPTTLATWALLAAALAYALHRYRLHRIECRNRELAELVAQRTEALALSESRERSASQAKSTFLANMSHELRTPLNAILLYSELIHGDAEEAGATDLARDSGRILSSGRHLLSLINGILDLSKIEAGKMTLDLEDLSLRTLLDDVALTLTPLARQKGIALRLALEGPDIALRTDGLKLKQVLLNLGGNAFKFTNEGSVTLGARREGDHARIEVRDTGVGLSADQISRIFEAYEQADRTGSSRGGGTGLGLTISRKFMDLLGGHIQVESEPGRGTTFRVLLPIDPQT